MCNYRFSRLYDRETDMINHRSQFSVSSDAHLAFEDYLNASKGALTASEIAKIRDTVGITGMGGA